MIGREGKNFDLKTLDCFETLPDEDYNTKKIKNPKVIWHCYINWHHNS